MHLGDSDLLYAYAREGDVKSLTVLVSRHETWLMAFLRGMLSHADADDAFQQVWFQVIKSVDHYRGGNVKYYLAQIARNVAKNKFAYNRRITEKFVDAEEADTLLDDLPHTGHSPLDLLETKSTVDDVRRSFQELPCDEREVILLRIEVGLTLKEIARTLRRPMGTVVSQINRGIERLKRIFNEKDRMKG